MKRLILSCLVGTTALIGAGAPAADDTGAWYVSPMVQYSILDSKRISNDNTGYQVGLGQNFAPNWAAEINASIGSFKIHNSGASQQLDAYAFDVMYKFLPDSTFRPYLLGGVGGMSDRIAGGIEDHHAGLAEAGGGVLVGVGPQTGSMRLQLRAEAKYRIEFLGSNPYAPRDPGDVVVSAGLLFMFGAPVAVIVTPPPPPPPPAATPPPPPPPPPAPPPPAPIGEIKLPRVEFETDKAVLRPESAQTLDSAVATLKKYPEMIIEVAGHTDSRGGKQHNVGLSERRAESVMQYLKEHGVTNRMTAHGYGEEEPIADNKTAEGRAANRRVGLRIVGGP
ncbi:MAG TPA: OmpA family protein [Steroidobacteraceae bacterium]